MYGSPTKYKSWLSPAQWWYNTSYHTTLKTSHFQALYVYTPPQLSIELILRSQNNEAQDLILQRQQMLQLLKENLEESSNRMKSLTTPTNTMSIKSHGQKSNFL